MSYGGPWGDNGVVPVPSFFPGFDPGAELDDWTDLASALTGPPANVVAAAALEVGTEAEPKIRIPGLTNASIRTYGLVQAVPAGPFSLALRVGIGWPTIGNGTLGAPQGQHYMGLVFCDGSGLQTRGVVLQLIGSMTPAASQARVVSVGATGAASNGINGTWTAGASNNSSGNAIVHGTTLYLERAADNTFTTWSGPTGSVPTPAETLTASAGAGFVGFVCQSPAAAMVMAHGFVLSQLLSLSYRPWETAS